VKQLLIIYDWEKFREEINKYINKMETKKILLWWFLYNIVGTLVGAGVGNIKNR